MLFPSVGGYDFESRLLNLPAHAAPWTAKALPGIVVLTSTAENLINPDTALPQRELIALADAGDSHFLTLSGEQIRLRRHDAGAPNAVLLPLDRLFEIRAEAALRLWRGLAGRRLGAAVGNLTVDRRRRLILALRALDGRRSGATYPEIAAGLFNLRPISKRDWISHELRDQTGRLVRLGFKLMKGGYRQLLLYPYRRLI